MKRVELVTPSPYEEFNQAARTAAEREQFTPALKDGEPVEYTLTYTYRFRLND